jgi:hypothetical protein
VSASSVGARVHLARTGHSDLDTSLAGFEELARASTAGHQLVDDPGEADLILLTQAHLSPDPLALRALRATEAWEQHRDRTYVIDFRDRPWCAFPGLYTSMPAGSFRPRWQRAWVYPWIDEERFLAVRPQIPDVLFSFVGGRSHRCREAVLALDDPDGIVEDSTGFDYLDASSTGDTGREHFVSVLGRSRFVLCPRGHGTSSFRLQEALAAGRVPVIISDDWEPPRGPDWAAACLRWPERRVGALPKALVELDGEYARMSAAAAALHDEWFSRGVMFDRMIEQLRALGSTKQFPAGGVRGFRYARLAAAQARARVSGSSWRRP